MPSSAKPKLYSDSRSPLCDVATSYLSANMQELTNAYSTRLRKSAEDLSQPHRTKKRTYEESFGKRDYEVERYGQEIPADFFKTNQGHGIM